MANYGDRCRVFLINYHLLLPILPILLLLTIFRNAQLGNAQFIALPTPTLESCNIDQIYQLGDSIADTGNRIRESPPAGSPSSVYSKLPYGQNFRNHLPTGRCSNGKLMIDYIASATGLPYLNPYKNVKANFTHGVNFAVAGSTALPVDNILAAKNISTSTTTNSSLDVQLHWMSMHFNSICHNDTDCQEKLKQALFMVGEIGGNDYNYANGAGKSLDEVKSMVPEVVLAIKNAARRVIHYGGTRLVIPGDFPAGCFPCYLTTHETHDPFAYDENRCVKSRNDFSAYHNDHLQEAIEELKQEFPNVTIVYGDYYNAFLWVFQNAQILGFEEQSIQKSCCGRGGRYNYDSNHSCGFPEATVCEDPDKRISWDGIHLTQAAYMNMAKWLLATITPQLQCSAFVSKGLSNV